MVERWFEKEDRWKDRAVCLKNRVRDRFRVAVDRHRRRQRSNGHVSETMQRWLQRFRHFRNESLASSSAFYRKRVGKEIDTEEDSVLTRMLQAVAVPVIGNVCHVFMHGLNHVQIYGAEKLQQALLSRPENTPLITVSNHIASMDDPLVIAALLPSSVLLHARNLRWTLCASDRCFRNPLTSAFFKHVKVMPVTRGEGIYQKGMDRAISKLNKGGWVHIFPEGSRSRDGGRTMGSMKRGIARLVLDADNCPMVVPFVHTGMQDVMPIGAAFPRVGKTVTILVGDPIDLRDVRDLEDDKNIPREKLYDAISARIGDRIIKLKAQVDKLALQPFQSENNSALKQARQEEQIDSGYQQDTNPHNQYRFSYEVGMVSRMRSYMDPTELMGFAARGFFMNQRMKEHIEYVQGVKPLKAWSNFWELVHQSRGVPSTSMLA